MGELIQALESALQPPESLPDGEAPELPGICRSQRARSHGCGQRGASQRQKLDVRAFRGCWRSLEDRQERACARVRVLIPAQRRLCKGIQKGLLAACAAFLAQRIVDPATALLRRDG